MSKDEILEQRMLECDIEKSDILNNIDLDGECAVLVYISRLEGLGNKKSDFDVYVFRKHASKKRDIIMRRINRAVCDIEEWTFDEIVSLIEQGDLKNNSSVLKLLKRIQIGVTIYENTSEMNSLKEKLIDLNIDDIIKQHFKLVANEEYDDAVKMYRSEEYEYALICLRRACDNAIAALNAHQSCGNLNLKWAPKILIDHNGYGITDIVDKYLKYQVYSNISREDLCTEVEGFLDFLTDILTYISVE